ncbi:MAG TPA: formate dehydrogenase subunit alpha [Marmoricola sp.]
MEITVDGGTVSVPDGSSVLTATRTAGADVPTLCHDDRLSPAGVCRVCLVRADGELVAACVTPARAGMVVETSDEEIADHVRLVVGLTIETLPARALETPSELTALCARLGLGAESFAGASDGSRLDDSHPYLSLDPDLCIACGRCVRMCDEVQGTFALSLVGRGADTEVCAGDGGRWVDSACVSCGGCADTCPTGAISTPPTAVATRTTRTTCGYCGVGCTLDVHTRDDRVVAVTPDRGGEVNRGHACVKGRFAHGYVHSADRLTTPLLRRHGELEPASWDEALAHVAGRLGRIRSEHGPDAIAAISSARATNEENYLLQKLMRAVVGTNNVDNCSRVCHSPSAVGLSAAFGLAGGTNPMEDLDRADMILLAGSNATEAHPVVGARIRQAVLRGARLVVVDPRRTELAALADVHLRGLPGSNVALFNGLARLLLENGWADLDFLAARASGLDDLQEVLTQLPLERVEEISGVSRSQMRAAAQLYGEAAHPAIVYGLGVTEHAHGTDGVRTLANLAILRGAVGTEDGGGVIPLRGQNNVQGASDMGALPDLLPGYQKVVDTADRRRFSEAWGVPVPPRPGLRIPEMFEAMRSGRVHALYVMGEDIAQTDPDSTHVRAAIEECELVISQEIFLSETARLADVVLPAASFLEKDGTFVNFDRRFLRVRPTVTPPGSARTDFDILTSVAAALGGDLGVRTPAEALEECARLAPLFAGVSHERLDREGGLHWPCRSARDPGEGRLYLDGFATPSGRTQLAARPWLPPGEEPSTEFPVVLITGRRLVHYNAGTMTRRTPNADLRPAEQIDLHPADADRLGVGEGDPVEVTSRRGSLVVGVHRTEATSPGQAFLAFHFPEVPTNRLTSEAADAQTACPEYKVTAVRLRPVGPAIPAGGAG